MCSPIWHACVSDLTVSLEEENVSCLSRLAGSPRSRGGRVAQPTSGSVEADSPHLHQTAALFWHGSENWPWWSLMSGGLRKTWGCNTLCCSLVPVSFERGNSRMSKQLLACLKKMLVCSASCISCQEMSCSSNLIERNSCCLVLNLNVEHLPEILESWYSVFVYPLICFYLLLPSR